MLDEAEALDSTIILDHREEVMAEEEEEAIRKRSLEPSMETL